MTDNSGYAEREMKTADSLTLRYRDYGSRFSTRMPILCLPGLTRNAKDFHDLALALSSSHRVVTLDARGRGRSDYDPDYTNYTLIREVGDILGLISQEFEHPCLIVGTSRGGLAAMILHGVRPDMIAGIILNDIGPELESGGLTRIMSYLGVAPEPLDTWDDAVAAMKASNEAEFADLDEADWKAWAERTFRDEDGVPMLDYDIRLRDAMIEAGSGVPDFWPQFRSLTDTPVLVLRGEHSDLLSADTVRKMRRIKPDLTALTVRGRGHVPFLDEPEARTTILSFVEQLDNAQSN